MSVSLQPARFASLSQGLGVVAPTAANAAVGYLSTFAAETLARAPELELAVEGRFDPADQDDDFFRRTLVISAATFDRYTEAVNTILRVMRERTGSSAAFTPYDALSLEGFTVGEVKAAVGDLLTRYGAGAPHSRVGWALALAAVGVGFLWWKGR